jgi:hypothetical protein
MLDLLITSPRTLHTFVGELGQTYTHLAPRYTQTAFWLLLSLVVLIVLGWCYTLIRRLFFEETDLF